MNSRSALYRERELAVLTRMEATRADLLAMHEASKVALAAKRTIALTPASLAAAFADAPRVALLGAILVGAVIPGPWRIASVVMRSGLTGWIAETVRQLAGR
jgi:hypothetical protein